eukprot:scaffold8728_cov105-Isochrysis_galbana.AAC.2
MWTRTNTHATPSMASTALEEYHGREIIGASSTSPSCRSHSAVVAAAEAGSSALARESSGWRSRPSGRIVARVACGARHAALPSDREQQVVAGLGAQVSPGDERRGHRLAGALGRPIEPLRPVRRQHRRQKNAQGTLVAQRAIGQGRSPRRGAERFQIVLAHGPAVEQVLLVVARGNGEKEHHRPLARRRRCGGSAGRDVSRCGSRNSAEIVPKALIVGGGPGARRLYGIDIPRSAQSLVSLSTVAAAAEEPGPPTGLWAQEGGDREK